MADLLFFGSNLAIPMTCQYAESVTIRVFPHGVFAENAVY
jgi:hypothetical protein